MRGIWHLPEGRIAYIPNGIDTSRFAPVPCRPDSGKELVIGTVGHLRREKNLGLLLRSVAALSRKMPVRLIIAGDGPERDALEREARELGIAGKVEFAGWQEDLPSTYSQFDIFALSSTTEQMPLSVLEAMASGLAVVSTHVGDVARMVAEVNRPAVVSPLDFESALKELAERPDWRARLGIANRARAVEAYSIERMFEDYDRLYTALSS
jgi:glycosyltransferase involved in cell wall biosynthesis